MALFRAERRVGLERFGFGPDAGIVVLPAVPGENGAGSIAEAFRDAKRLAGWVNDCAEVRL